MLAVRQTIPGRARPGTPAPLVLQTTEEDNMTSIEIRLLDDSRGDAWGVLLNNEAKATIYKARDSDEWSVWQIPGPPEHYDEFGDAVGAVVANLVAGCSELEK